MVSDLTEISVLQDMINIYAKEHYQHLEPEQLKAEAERMQQHLCKHSAGRLCSQSLRQWQADYTNFDAYCKEKKEWEQLFKSILRQSTGTE